MVIDKETVEYFHQMHMHRDVNEIKAMIYSWLEIMYNTHDIDNREWIYNSDEIVNEFYEYVLKNGKDETIV